MRVQRMPSIGQVQQAKNRSVDTRGDSARPQQPVADMTHGGAVRGIGGPVDDANLIAASNGEMVLPADTVQALGGEEAINGIIAKTHTPAAVQRARGIGAPVVPQSGLPGRADGGSTSPWDDEYKQGGSLYTGGIARYNQPSAPAPAQPDGPVSAAVAATPQPTAGVGAPAPAATATAPATTSVDTQSGLPKATTYADIQRSGDSFSSSGTAAPTANFTRQTIAGDQRVGGWNAGVDTAKKDPNTGYPMANGGAVRPRIGGMPAYADGGSPDDDEDFFDNPYKRTPPTVNPFFDNPSNRAPVVAVVPSGPQQNVWQNLDSAAAGFFRPAPIPPGTPDGPQPNAEGGFDVDNRQEARPSIGTASVEPAVVTAPSAVKSQAPQQPPRVMYGNEGRGNGQPYVDAQTIPEAAQPGPRLNLNGEQNPQQQGIGGMTTEQANAVYGAQNDARRAAAAMNHDAQQQRMDIAGRSIGDRLDAEKAAWEAKVDRSSILAGGEYGTDVGAAKAAASERAAVAARGQSNRSIDAYMASQGPNYAGQNAAIQQAGEEAQRNDLAGTEQRQRIGQAGVMNPLQAQSERQKIAGGELDQKSKQLLYDTTQALANATTPEQEAKATKTLLALHGKTEPGWKAIAYGGQQVVDPQTGAVTNVGGNVMLYNQVTGQKEYHTAQDNAPAKPIPPQAAIDVLAKDPTPRMKALFDKTYYKGAADQFLGK